MSTKEAHRIRREAMQVAIGNAVGTGLRKSIGAYLFALGVGHETT